MLNVDAIREDFPILKRKVNGKNLVYLDSGATSQKPRTVIQALVDYYQNYNSNVHRGIHTLSEEATAKFEQVREKVANFINCNDTESIIFVRNTTEGVNLVAHAWGRRNVNSGDEILVTEMEHHSNLIPWQLLAKEKKAVLKHVKVTDNGLLDLSNLEELITPETKVVAVTRASNVLGTINPVRQIADVAHRVGAKVMVDGAQSVPHLITNVKELDCDFLAFSSHKMLGPTGVGVIFIRKELLEEMDPFLGGGNMIREVWIDRATWNHSPWKYEAGTPDIAGVIGFGAALDYLQQQGMKEIREHEMELTGYALKKLRDIEDITIYGPQDPERQTGSISFNIADIHPHDVGTILSEEGVAIRAGHHCSQPLMRRFKIYGTARASFYLYNTAEEVDILIEALKKAKQIFAHVCH